MMMTAVDSGGGSGTEQPPQQQTAQMASSRLPGRTPKEGERILAPTRRPDGTLRKPVRIRAGYVPQDEVAIYQSKGALLRKAAQSEVPPGYDPALDAKPKTKSAKRNERRKEKKQQAALASAVDKGKSLEEAAQVEIGSIPATEQVNSTESAESLTSQMTVLSLSEEVSAVGPPPDSQEILNHAGPGPDLDKKIRALKKKIRLATQQRGDQQDLKPEQLEKLAKVEGWREELKLLEEKRAALAP